MTIEMRDVRCGYRDSIVVDGFSSSVSSGEILCLLGPNGIGKTTLFKTILGFLPLRGGSITVDGRDIRELTSAERAQLIGYVPQAHVPPFAFKVFDVVAMGRTAHLGMFGNPGKKDWEIAYNCLERLEILHLLDRVYTELSGGERQMVLVARALAQSPAFLMMDEPTSNLDFGNQVRVLQNAKKLAREGLGVIMTTHFPDHVFQCDANVSFMKKDRQYLSGTAFDVLTEETLQEAYGIQVAVMSADHKGRVLHFCQPMMDEETAVPAKEESLRM